MRLRTVTNARVHGEGLVDVVIEDGLIGTVRPAGSTEPGPDVLDAGGALLLPTLVDAHCHPDKTTWGEPWVSRGAARLSRCRLSHTA